jgi:CheY-like chemotaxis protein/signal transduction histidine kinase
MALSYSRSLFWKLFTPFAILLLLSFVAAAVFLPALIQGNAEREAIAAGKDTVRQFKALRTYYTDNVVAKVLARGTLRVDSEHLGKDDTVPLPATMIHDLSAMLRESGTTLKLYSPYPFPNRGARTLDGFGQEAWAFLRANPEQTFSRIESLDGKTVVRVAMADRMNRQACVACHNSLPTSPKRDWKLGDVRGVLEVDSSRQLATGRNVVFQLFAAFGATLILLSLLLRLFYQRAIGRPLDIALAAARTLTEGSVDKVRAAEAIANGDLERDIALARALRIAPAAISRDEAGQLLTSVVELGAAQMALDQAFRSMTASLRASRDENEARNWIKSGQNELNNLMRGEQELALVADKVLSFLAERIGAGAGALLLYQEERATLCLVASYAILRGMPIGAQVALGQGLVGQAAKERKTLLVTEVPPDYLPLGSVLGNAAPACLVVLPLLHGANLVGVIELAGFRRFTAAELALLDTATEAIAIGFEVSLSRQRSSDLLEETEQQSEELRVQQEELQQSNEELEERAELLVRQRQQIEARNAEIEAASLELRHKAEQLQVASAYKSEFMANMSHELRTPLNSMLILSGLLKENKNAALSPKQVEYATTINTAGKDLLNLINDILDLSKVEAGQVEFHVEDAVAEDLCIALRQLFDDSARQKGLRFAADCDAALPPLVRVDVQRTLQVLKNLIGNAIKFTERGQVALRLFLPEPADNPLPVAALACAVSDTGIGVPAAKREVIFDAFKQADGGISRNYGGTGLGLSISLQLARGMDGALTLDSEEGRGSTFTLYLPLAGAPTPAPAPRQAHAPLAPAPAHERERMAANGRSILVIEDDPAFAGILADFVRAHGFAAIVAGDGESGVALAGHFVPSAIVLDVRLPRLDGWDVMLRLKQNPATRHIPVHFISCTEQGERAMEMGAVGFVSKPVSVAQLNQVIGTIEAALDTALRKLLIVEDDVDQAASLSALLAERGLAISVAASGRDAIALLEAEHFDCLVLDLGLPDMSGVALLAQLQQMEQARRIPVIVHSGCALSAAQESELRRYAARIIVKDAHSPARLLNEVTLFLHMLERGPVAASAAADPVPLDGKLVLIVDDDMRNVFSLTSLLSEHGMAVLEAENGTEALARLAAHPEIGIVLMDIMMPEMDGYECMRRIRADPAHHALPLIAMTAKAMRGDQQKCIAAGASDYIAKPIDTDKLMSLLRVWCRS